MVKMRLEHQSNRKIGANPLTICEIALLGARSVRKWRAKVDLSGPPLEGP